MHHNVPVCNNLEELQSFLKRHNHLNVCLYVAYKTPAEWSKSTSYIYMNEVDNRFVYLPVNIQKDDSQMLESVYKLSEDTPQIVAINQTQPHKSNSILKKWLSQNDLPENIDSLIKLKDGKLKPFDLNGPSFVSWFEDDVEQFDNKQIVILGVGGAGEPIARKIAEKSLNGMWLVDIISKEYLVNKLSFKNRVNCTPSLEEIEVFHENILFINCAGKEGISEAGIFDFLQKYKSPHNIFVDLRPHLELETVKTAQKLGWRAYTGFGMNSKNDYTLLLKIFEQADIPLISFNKFQKLVERAS